LDIFLAIMQSVGKRSAARAELERSETQTIKKSNNNYFVETRALEESVEKSRNNSARAKKANETMRAKYGLDKAVPVAAPSPAEEIVFGLPKVSAPLLPGMAAARRKTLEYFFVHTCGAPEEDTWLRDGIVSGIMKHCQIPRGSSAEVKKVFKDMNNFTYLWFLNRLATSENMGVLRLLLVCRVRAERLGKVGGISRKSRKISSSANAVMHSCTESSSCRPADISC
jgi:hypothetical protein